LLHEVIFASLFQKSTTNNSMMWRHIYAVMILNAVDHIQDGTGGLEARMNQKDLKQIF